MKSGRLAPETLNALTPSAWGQGVQCFRARRDPHRGELTSCVPPWGNQPEGTIRPYPMSTSRRQFLTRSTLAGAAVAAGAAPAVGATSAVAKPAILGGKPVHTGGWQTWPVWKAEWEAEMLKVCRSGKWNQAAGGAVADFQRRWAELMGARRCLATSSGTTALITALHVVGVDADADGTWPVHARRGVSRDGHRDRHLRHHRDDLRRRRLPGRRRDDLDHRGGPAEGSRQAKAQAQAEALAASRGA